MINFIYTGLVIVLATSNFAFSDQGKCSDLSGIYQDGNEYECSFSSDRKHYVCQKYKLIVQSNCSDLTFFRKEVILNPDDESSNFSFDQLKLQRTDSKVPWYEGINNSRVRIDKPNWFPEGNCQSEKIKSIATSDGFLITTFDCQIAGTFTETILSLANSKFTCSQRSAPQAETKPVAPGKWGPWLQLDNLTRLKTLPAVTYSYSDISSSLLGNVYGDYELTYRRSGNSGWSIEAVGRVYDSKEWYKLDDNKINGLLNSLNTNKKYLCSFKAMTNAGNILVESLENCKAF